MRGFLASIKARIATRRAGLYRWAHVALPLALLLGITGLRVSGSSWIELAQFQAFDAFMRRKPRLHRQAPVRIVDIDEASLRKLGQWPWPREILARLVDKISAAGAAAIAFDMVFPETDRLGPRNDAAFARS